MFQYSEFNFMTYSASGALSLMFAHDGKAHDASGQVGPGVNMIWVRARTPSSSVASFDGLFVNLSNGDVVELGDLVGDSNAQYVGYYDARLAGGFSLGFRSATLSPPSNGAHSNVMLQVKVGQTAAIPEPGTWAMMIGGFGLAGAALRRRRSLVEA